MSDIDYSVVLFVCLFSNMLMFRTQMCRCVQMFISELTWVWVPVWTEKKKHTWPSSVSFCLHCPCWDAICLPVLLLLIIDSYCCYWPDDELHQSWQSLVWVWWRFPLQFLMQYDVAASPPFIETLQYKNLFELTHLSPPFVPTTWFLLSCIIMYNNNIHV